MKRFRSAAELLALPVRVRGITLGRPAAVLLDTSAGRAIGLDVGCRDGVHRFLPLAAATVGPDAIEIDSPLFLLSEHESAFYQARTDRFEALGADVVRRDGRALGVLADVTLAADGAVAALVVETDRGRIELAPDPALTLRPLPVRAA